MTAAKARNVWWGSVWTLIVLIWGSALWPRFQAFGPQDRGDAVSIFIAIVGSLAGAFAGAYIAQVIAERAKVRDELIREIRNTNAGINLAMSIAQAMLRLKKQHFINLIANYNATRAKVIEDLELRATGQRQGNVPLHLGLEMRQVPPPNLPIDALLALVFDKLSATGRLITAAIELHDARATLIRSFELREAQVDKMRRLGGNQVAAIHYYFSISDGSGTTSTEVMDTLNMLMSVLDQIAFFAEIVTIDLHEHGQKLVKSFGERFSDEPPKVQRAIFDPARKTGLMPSHAQFADWLAGFKPASEFGNDA